MVVVPNHRAGSTLVGVFSLLFVSILINYIDRGNLSIAAPLLKDELQISASQLGAFILAFFWTYSAVQIISGFRRVDGDGLRFGLHWAQYFCVRADAGRTYSGWQMEWHTKLVGQYQVLSSTRSLGSSWTARAMAVGVCRLRRCHSSGRNFVDPIGWPPHADQLAGRAPRRYRCRNECGLS